MTTSAAVSDAMWLQAVATRTIANLHAWKEMVGDEWFAFQVESAAQSAAAPAAGAGSGKEAKVDTAGMLSTVVQGAARLLLAKSGSLQELNASVVALLRRAGADATSGTGGGGAVTATILRFSSILRVDDTWRTPHTTAAMSKNADFKSIDDACTKVLSGDSGGHRDGSLLRCLAYVATADDADTDQTTRSRRFTCVVAVAVWLALLQSTHDLSSQWSRILFLEPEVNVAITNLLDVTSGGGGAEAGAGGARLITPTAEYKRGCRLSARLLAPLLDASADNCCDFAAWICERLDPSQTTFADFAECMPRLHLGRFHSVSGKKSKGEKKAAEADAGAAPKKSTKKDKKGKKDKGVAAARVMQRRQTPQALRRPDAVRLLQTFSKLSPQQTPPRSFLLHLVFYLLDNPANNTASLQKAARALLAFATTAEDADPSAAEKASASVPIWFAILDVSLQLRAAAIRDGTIDESDNNNDPEKKQQSTAIAAANDAAAATLATSFGSLTYTSIEFSVNRRQRWSAKRVKKSMITTGDADNAATIDDAAKFPRMSLMAMVVCHVLGVDMRGDSSGSSDKYRGIEQTDIRLEAPLWQALQACLATAFSTVQRIRSKPLHDTVARAFLLRFVSLVYACIAAARTGDDAAAIDKHLVKFYSKFSARDALDSTAALLPATVFGSSETRAFMFGTELGLADLTVTRVTQGMEISSTDEEQGDVKSGTEGGTKDGDDSDLVEFAHDPAHMVGINIETGWLSFDAPAFIIKPAMLDDAAHTRRFAWTDFADEPRLVHRWLTILARLVDLQMDLARDSPEADTMRVSTTFALAHSGVPNLFMSCATQLLEYVAGKTSAVDAVAGEWVDAITELFKTIGAASPPFACLLLDNSNVIARLFARAPPRNLMRMAAYCHIRDVLLAIQRARVPGHLDASSAPITGIIQMSSGVFSDVGGIDAGLPPLHVHKSPSRRPHLSLLFAGVVERTKALLYDLTLAAEVRRDKLADLRDSPKTTITKSDSPDWDIAISRRFAHFLRFVKTDVKQPIVVWLLSEKGSSSDTLNAAGVWVLAREEIITPDEAKRLFDVLSAAAASGAYAAGAGAGVGVGAGAGVRPGPSSGPAFAGLEAGLDAVEVVDNGSLASASLRVAGAVVSSKQPRQDMEKLLSMSSPRSTLVGQDMLAAALRDGDNLYRLRLAQAQQLSGGAGGASRKRKRDSDAVRVEREPFVISDEMIAMTACDLGQQLQQAIAVDTICAAIENKDHDTISRFVRFLARDASGWPGFLTAFVITGRFGSKPEQDGARNVYLSVLDCILRYWRTPMQPPGDAAAAAAGAGDIKSRSSGKEAKRMPVPVAQTSLPSVNEDALRTLFAWLQRVELPALAAARETPLPAPAARAVAEFARQCLRGDNKLTFRDTKRDQNRKEKVKALQEGYDKQVEEKNTNWLMPAEYALDLVKDDPLYKQYGDNLAAAFDALALMPEVKRKERRTKLDAFKDSLRDANAAMEEAKKKYKSWIKQAQKKLKQDIERVDKSLGPLDKEVVAVNALVEFGLRRILTPDVCLGVLEADMKSAATPLLLATDGHAEALWSYVYDVMPHAIEAFVDSDGRLRGMMERVWSFYPSSVSSASWPFLLDALQRHWEWYTGGAQRLCATGARDASTMVPYTAAGFEQRFMLIAAGRLNGAGFAFLAEKLARQAFQDPKTGYINLISGDEYESMMWQAVLEFWRTAELVMTRKDHKNDVDSHLASMTAHSIVVQMKIVHGAIERIVQRHLIFRSLLLHHVESVVGFLIHAQCNSDAVGAEEMRRAEEHKRRMQAAALVRQRTAAPVRMSIDDEDGDLVMTASTQASGGGGGGGETKTSLLSAESATTDVTAADWREYAQFWEDAYASLFARPGVKQDGGKGDTSSKDAAGQDGGKERKEDDDGGIREPETFFPIGPRALLAWVRHGSRPIQPLLEIASERVKTILGGKGFAEWDTTLPVGLLLDVQPRSNVLELARGQCRSRGLAFADTRQRASDGEKDGKEAKGALGPRPVSDDPFPPLSESEIAEITTFIVRNGMYDDFVRLRDEFAALITAASDGGGDLDDVAM